MGVAQNSLRSTDNGKDTTMIEEAFTCSSVLGLDVGKFSHWACLVTRLGTTTLNRLVPNTEEELDKLFSQVAKDTLVVVDQVHNIGSLPIKRARLAGLSIAYLPGLAAHGASKLFAGNAKTDERDAHVIAKTALGIPDALLPVPRENEKLEAARLLASQRDHMITCGTRDKNRLRSILLESCPSFEALVDLSDSHWLSLLEKLGGPWGILDAGKASFGGITKGANRKEMDAAWDAIEKSTRPSQYKIIAENPQIKFLACRIREAIEQANLLDEEIARFLDAESTYRCLLTVPGIGPRTASELVISIQIEDFPNHNHLASYCGIAPKNRQSGTSILSVSASRSGNKRLKNLLIFSCNSLVRSKNYFGEYYRNCRKRGMCHGEALKAVARKRLKVIYAIMRDGVPYAV